MGRKVWEGRYGKKGVDKEGMGRKVWEGRYGKEGMGRKVWIRKNTLTKKEGREGVVKKRKDTKDKMGRVKGRH